MDLGQHRDALPKARKLRSEQQVRFGSSDDLPPPPRSVLSTMSMFIRAEANAGYRLTSLRPLAHDPRVGGCRDGERRSCERQ